MQANDSVLGPYTPRKFLLENCEGREPAFETLQTAFLDTIRPALDDVRDKGLDRTHGYKALFKQNSTTSIIERLLRDMYLLKEIKGVLPSPTRYLQPRLVCVDDRTASTYASLNFKFDPLQKCWSIAKEASNQYTFYMPATAYIFVCPSFFTQSATPSNRHCPSIQKHRFVGSQWRFHQRYQVYRIIYELARFYLGKHALDATSSPPETFNWNDCVYKLNTLESVVNPSNLELYVACR